MRKTNKNKNRFFQVLSPSGARPVRQQRRRRNLGTFYEIIHFVLAKYIFIYLVPFAFFGGQQEKQRRANNTDAQHD